MGAMDFFIESRRPYTEIRKLKDYTHVKNDLRKMFCFQSFWESTYTWEALNELELVLKDLENHEPQYSGEVCQEWLKQYKRVEEATKRFVLDKNHETKKELANHIDSWKAVTKKLSGALRWYEGNRPSYWPFKWRPTVKVGKPYVEEYRLPQSSFLWDYSPPTPVAHIENIFNDIDARIEHIDQNKMDPPFSTILGEDWAPYWTKTIDSIQYLPNLKCTLRFEGLEPLRDDCLKRGEWRGYMMEIHPCQRISII